MAKSNDAGMFMTVVEAFTEFNGAFFNTLKGLTLQPRETVNGFLSDPNSGRYINPFRFAVLTISAYVVCASFFGMDMSSEFAEGMEMGKGSELSDREKDNVEFIGSLLDNSIMFLWLISLAPTAWLMSKLFKASGHNSITCYKIALYANGMSTVLYLVLALPIFLFLPEQYASIKVDIIGTLTLLTIPYVVWFYISYFQVTFWTGLWKSLVTMLWSMFIFTFLSALVSFSAAVYSGYQEASNEAENVSKITPSHDYLG